MKRIFLQISLLLTMVMSLQAQNTILDSSVHSVASGSSLQSMIFNNHPPKHEVRAVWLTTIGGIDWPHSYAQSAYSAEKQKQELVEILNRLQKAHINTVLIQTRVRGTMIYPSAYEPWDGCLSGFPGKSPGYDALKFAIEECHKRGMECHAWVVTIPVGKWNALGCKQLRSRFPGLIRKIGPDGYMNPEDNRTADYLAKICGEITRNYDVDGIHLDYIRYPETWNIRVSRENGRQFITRIVEAIHRSVKREKPWVKMSCSPIGKFDDLGRYWSHGWNAYTKVCQDAQGWLKSGLMDELYPMMYFRNEQFFPFAIDWAEQSHGKIVVPGLGVYFLDPKEGKWKIGDITSEMYHLRNIGLGHAFFRNKFLLDNRQGIYDFTSKEFNLYPSLVPAMKWESKRIPVAPSHLKTQQVGEKVVLTWNNSAQYEDGTAVSTPYIYNNVYASRTYPVDTEDARNLISARMMGNRVTLDLSGDENPLFFAVTAMDGYGNESRPVQNIAKVEDFLLERQGKAKKLKCSNGRLFLPESAKNADATCFLVESLLGQPLKVLRSAGNSLNIRSLSEGVYVLKSLNKKGVSHTLGTFYIRKNKKS